MCLGMPGQVLSVSGKVAVVDFWGVHKNVRLDHVAEPVAVGDYIIDHAGFAVRKLAASDVDEVLGMYEVILTEAGCDPIATDIVDELACTDEVGPETQRPALV